MINAADLILNKDGSIYHLSLLPNQICDNIILVGDPDRIAMIEKKFDRTFFSQQTREFKCVMGECNGQEILVVSTGIGTDNIDIVFNELDALANIDFETRAIKKKKRVLNFYRIGTSGAIRKEIEVDRLLVSTHGIGLDVLMHYYQRVPNETLEDIATQISKLLKKEGIPSGAYATVCNAALLKSVPKTFSKGMTLTLPGFYGPQGRVVRAANKSKNFLDKIRGLSFGKNMITNFEMETAGIYGMAEILGHRAISFNALVANRELGIFSKNPQKVIEQLIDEVLEII
jgi:uridine phosphorylase